MATVRNRGFTLAEILVASTITTFIAVVAVGALKTVSDSAQTVTRHSETVTEVRFAARMLARDLANVYRDQDPRAMRLVGTSQSADSAMAFLRFYATGRTNARHGQPEGDVYEVEYFLGRGAGIEAASQDQLGSSTLYRRLWPNPDEDRPPGGILVSLAQNIDVFQMRFFDGRQWTTDWPEEMRSLPQLIEVTLVMLPPQGQGNPIIETFLVNFPRLATATDAASAVESGRPGGQNQPPQGEGPTAAPR